MIRWKRLFPLFLGAACSVFLAGCHGSRETEAFQPPETFDETKAYEITFWAKMTPTSVRRTFTKRPLRISRPCIPISL